MFTALLNGLLGFDTGKKYIVVKDYATHIATSESAHLMIVHKSDLQDALNLLYQAASLEPDVIQLYRAVDLNPLYGLYIPDSSYQFLKPPCPFLSGLIEVDDFNEAIDKMFESVMDRLGLWRPEGSRKAFSRN